MDKATQSPPLYERKAVNNTIPRIIELIILFLLFSLLAYRLRSPEKHGFIWLVAFVCELWFTYTWILAMNCKWNPVKYETYPERLLQRTTELPHLDMFVTTADDVLEPAILTINTVLSLLAVDYPGDKLACYVSDDAASPLTFYCLVEASKFAKLWVPFCKKYNVAVRAPFRYFNGDVPRNSSSEFQEEWKKMKEQYAELCQNIEYASQKTIPCDLTGDFAVFANIERRNHSTIIKVISENKEDLPNGVPHLIYISREKRPNHPHHFKAGALNALTKVSGMMTNAPFILNVDCDVYANNPQVVLHAMCLLLGAKDEKESGFVQFPQHFYDSLKDDPFGNQMIVTVEYFGRGITGIQGPFYTGTGCFHRRKIIYGASPEDKLKNGKLRHENFQNTYGKSMKFTKLVDEILSESRTAMDTSQSLSSAIEEANLVASCGYEYGSSWGKTIGFLYGSTAEDILTGLSIHARGWQSTRCNPSPSVFVGLAPTSGPASLLQQKRWSVGVLEILFSFRNPIVLSLNGKLQFRQCLAYLWIIQCWGMRPIFEVCYAILPAFCILNNSYFLPKVNESSIVIVISLLIIYNMYSLSEYFRIGQTMRAWWNNQRMTRLITMTSWLFGFLSVLLKKIGLSESTFEVTKKDQSSNAEDRDEKSGRFTFDDSPLIVPGITILFVNLSALGIGILGFNKENESGKGWGIGEFVCSTLVVLCFWVFLKGLFGKGKYGIPFPTIYKAGALALVFIHLSRSTSLG